jgi:hypothetical protein
VVTISVAPTRPRAQERIQDQIDFARIISDARRGTSPTEAVTPATTTSLKAGFFTQARETPKPQWSLKFTGPFHYIDKNSATKGESSGWEGVPDVKGGFSQPVADLPVVFSATADASSDRFSMISGTANPTDSASGVFRLDFARADADPQVLTPYVYYSPQWAYSPFFATSTAFTQDMSVGFNKLWDFATDFGKPETGEGKGGWELGLLMAFQHRFIYGMPDSNAMQVAPSIKFLAPAGALDGMAVGATVNLSGRWYDPTAKGLVENDWNVQPVLTVAWAFLKRPLGKDGQKKFGSPELDFQVSYASQSSNVAAAVFQKLSVGPTISFGWKF